MACKEKPKKTEYTNTKGVCSERITIPASKVGVTLKLSEKTLDEIDRLADEAYEAALKGKNLSWR